MIGLFVEYMQSKWRLRRGMREYTRNGFQSPLIVSDATRQCSPYASWKVCLKERLQGMNRSSRRR